VFFPCRSYPEGHTILPNINHFTLGEDLSHLAEIGLSPPPHRLPSQQTNTNERFCMWVYLDRLGTSATALGF
jgi:hypothetical protein